MGFGSFDHRTPARVECLFRVDERGVLRDHFAGEDRAIGYG